MIFDRRSSLGLVRLRVKKTTSDLDLIFQKLLEKTQTSGGYASPFAEITDADIDNLFRD